MTQKEAKELTLELWRYLAEHPECDAKESMPRDLYKRIKPLLNKCPLCELFVGKDCEGCPLQEADEQCAQEHSAYDIWAFGGTDFYREEGAGRIVEIVSAWEPEEGER
jgi:hypothetical protein